MYKSDDKRYTLPMKNAEASVRMEGCQVTPQMREQCQRVLRGEVTTAELLRRFLPSLPGVEVYPPLRRKSGRRRQKKKRVRSCISGGDGLQ